MSQSWGYTHMYYNYITACDSGWEYQVLRAMSMPSLFGSLRTQFYFVLFYTVTIVFCFMNCIIYWAVTIPHAAHHNGGEVPPLPSVSAQPNATVTWSSSSDVEIWGAPCKFPPSCVLDLSVLTTFLQSPTCSARAGMRGFS
jgi:hypothetical protein